MLFRFKQNDICNKSRVYNSGSGFKFNEQKEQQTQKVNNAITAQVTQMTGVIS